MDNLSNSSLFLREWSPQLGLLSKIPEKAQKGFTTLELSLTCIGVLSDFLAVGTNVGLIYWYDRKHDTLERLKIEGSMSPVSCISVVHTLDYMVAAGNRDGTISIFQIPHTKESEEVNNEWHATGSESSSIDQKKAQIFTVRDLHKCAITALEWSSNGMKLFSGDASGVVVGTEIDFFKCQSKSAMLLDEKYAIVQLSYLHLNLLVSTTLRSVIYSTETLTVQRIGTQERKIHGSFGAVFEPGLWSRNHKIYTVRPGLRIWVAGQDGSVQNTIIFKDLVGKPHPSIPVISASIPKPKLAEQEHQFGCLHNFMNKYLVSWYKNVLFVLDPANVEIVGACYEFSSILCISVCKDEIFVLETDRNIIRISSKQEALPRMKEHVLPDNGFKGLPDLLTSSFPDFGKMHDKPLNFIATKIKETSRALPKFNSTVLSTLRNVIEADVSIQDGQFTVLPQVIPLPDSDIPNITVQHSIDLLDDSSSEVENKLPLASSHSHYREIQKFDRISQESYEDVLLTQFKPEKRTKGKKSKFGLLGPEALSDSISMSSQYSSNSESDLIGSEPRRKSSTDSSCSNTAFSFASSTATVFSRAREDVAANANDLQSKEFMLAKLLDWSELLPNYDGAKDSVSDAKANRETPDAEKGNESPLSRSVEMNTPDTLMSENCASSSSGRPSLVNAEPRTDLDEKRSIYDSESDQHQLDSSLDIYNKYRDSSLNSNFEFGPPSGSSNMNLAEGYQSSTSVLERSMESFDEREFREPTNLHDQLVALSVQDIKVDGVPGNDHWIQYKLPIAVNTIASCDNYIICTDYQNKVYYSALNDVSLQWVKTDYTARIMSVSSDASVLWRIDPNGDLYTLLSPSPAGPFSIDGGWELVCEKVKCCAVSERMGWTVLSNDSVFVGHFGEGITVPKFQLVQTPWSISHMHINASGVWALSTDGRALYRSGMTAQCEQGDLWNELRLSIPPIGAVSLGPQSSVFLADVHNNIHFISGVTHKTPSGNHIWNITISDYISTAVTATPSPILRRLTEPFRSSFSQSRSSIPLLTASDTFVWFTLQGSASVYVNKICTTGHRWEPALIEGAFKTRKWSQAYAGSIYRDHGLLWVTDLKGKLWYLSFNGKLEALDLPCSDTLVHITPAPEALWILTGKGDIYARCNISAKNDLGNGWDVIQLSALNNVHIVHMSCGSEVAWACDNKGCIYIRSGSLSPPSPTDMSPAWIEVEGGPTCGAESIFTKIYVGTNGHMVWALDDRRNIYAREAIFPELPIGTAWVLVPSIEAVSLAISDNAVWALSPKGEIYRRFGISKTNFVGDCWCKIPGNAKVLTVSVCDEVWVVDGNGHLVKHTSETLQFGKSSSPSTKSLDAEDTEWELLG